MRQEKKTRQEKRYETGLKREERQNKNETRED
jgi:hypothetical protein